MLGQAIKPLSNQHILSSGLPSSVSHDHKCNSWADFVRQVRIQLSGKKEMSCEGECVKFFVVLDR